MEIERKFRVPEGTAIDDLFASFSNGESISKEATETLVDAYFDTDDYQLCTKDVWLRRRDQDGHSRWEVKCRPSIATQTAEVERGSSAVQKYIELTCEDEIASLVCRLLNLSTTTLSVLSRSSLKSFCKIDTVRDSYSLNVFECADIGPATVVIDSCFHGSIALGEIELQLNRDASTDEQDKAERAINKIISRFGLEDISEGKVEFFIRTTMPSLWQRLIPLFQPQT